MTIREGENLAILGPNGAGKSTFVRTILREHYPVDHEQMVFRVRGKESWDMFDSGQR